MFVSLESMQSVQKCSEQLILQNTRDGCFQKLKLPFSITELDASGWMNKKS